jgi:hypothetical protein
MLFLCVDFFSFLFLLGLVTALVEVGGLFLGATGSTRSPCDDVYDYFTIVFATILTRRMRYTQSATCTGREAHARYSVMRTAFGRLGTIASHAYYHMGRSILGKVPNIKWTSTKSIFGT